MAKFLKDNIAPVDTGSMAEQLVELISQDPELRRLGCDSPEMKDRIRKAFKDPEVSRQFSERVLADGQLKDLITQMRVHATVMETKRNP